MSVCVCAHSATICMYLCLHISHRPYFIVWNYSEIIINIEFIDVSNTLFVFVWVYDHLPFMCDTNYSILKASIGWLREATKRIIENIIKFSEFFIFPRIFSIWTNLTRFDYLHFWMDFGRSHGLLKIPKVKNGRLIRIWSNNSITVDLVEFLSFDRMLWIQILWNWKNWNLSL